MMAAAVEDDKLIEEEEQLSNHNVNLQKFLDEAKLKMQADEESAAKLKQKPQ